ncbi:MAG: carboxypeptidase regulatory-like domain-containing protein, partial [Bacteroidales bacterium]|nr:carboxypeptidase regulatory-like domain-containing protein [Bacteroidales bacterium]
MASFLSRLTAVAAMALLIVQTAGAQVSVKIKLVDSRTQEAIGFATVSLTSDGKNPTVKYTQADSSGVAILNNVKSGKYTLKGNMMGYDEYTERVTVSNKPVDMGIGEMNMQANYLDGATITDTGNPIVVKQDTIEHNVTLMKTTADETLEDLLKRLPGIEIENGKVTANGKEIKKITVEDRTFFLNDLQMTTKNLPAKAIEKVKIIDRMSEQAQFTGIDDGEEETIIDLTMVKGARGQWFGNAMVGAGQDFHAPDADGNPVKNDFRFQGAGMAAKFGKKDQIAIVGNANNTNNRGFDDFARSMMSSVRNSNARTTNNGITTSYMLGANAGLYFRNKTEVTGNYIFSGSNKDVSEHSERLTFKTDGSTLDAVNEETNYSNAYGHSAGVRADWKISNRTSILFEPRFNYGYGDYDELTNFFTDQDFTSYRAKVNDGYSHSFGNND